jgi:hypothetical protein
MYPAVMVQPNGVQQALRPKGSPGRGGAMPGPNPGGPVNGQEVYAANLAIYYEPVRYDNGSMGVKISRPPAGNSPVASLQFDPGDVIFELDGQRFANPQDVLNHRGETTIDFIDVRTGERRQAVVNLP